MKVSAMSDTELSRWISEKLGIAEYGLSGGTNGFFDEKFAGPDMIHDTAMTVMLIKNLIDAFTDCRKGFDLIADEFAGHPPFSSQLGRNVAEAYALANGLEEG